MFSLYEEKETMHTHKLIGVLLIKHTQHCQISK